MTENKRFGLVCNNNVEWLIQSELVLPIKDKNTNKKITLKQCLDLLNRLTQDEQSDNITYFEIQIRKLEKENKKLQSEISWENIKYGTLKILYDENNGLKAENEQLKKEVEDLKQIYQKKEITYDSVDEAIYKW